MQGKEMVGGAGMLLDDLLRRSLSWAGSSPSRPSIF